MSVSEFWNEEASRGKSEMCLLCNTNRTGHIYYTRPEEARGVGHDLAPSCHHMTPWPASIKDETRTFGSTYDPAAVLNGVETFSYSGLQVRLCTVLFKGELELPSLRMVKPRRTKEKK